VTGSLFVSGKDIEFVRPSCFCFTLMRTSFILPFLQCRVITDLICPVPSTSKIHQTVQVSEPNGHQGKRWVTFAVNFSLTPCSVSPCVSSATSFAQSNIGTVPSLWSPASRPLYQIRIFIRWSDNHLHGPTTQTLALLIPGHTIFFAHPHYCCWDIIP